MPSSFISCHMHYVFSTKERRNLIFQDMQTRLWAFMGGIARQNNITAIAVGGTDNHAHLLLSLPATMPIAKAAQMIKGGSSGWVTDTFPACPDFAWQEGYGAFSVSMSAVEQVKTYILTQAEHHKTMTFEDEYLTLLDKHPLTYDRGRVFG